MNTDLVILFYYACFMGMAGWMLTLYANQILKSMNDSDKNPVPQELMDKYIEEQHNVTSEEDQEESSSEDEADAESTDAETESKEVEWGGEEQQERRGRPRERIAIARFHGEHEE